MTLKYLAERGLENPQMIAISEGVGSGSKLFQSLLDSHPEVYMIPGYALMYFYPYWHKVLQHKKLNDWDLILDDLIKVFSSIFDTGMNPGSETLNQLGEKNDETITVNIDSFRKHFLLLTKNEPVSTKNCLIAFHCAYALAKDEVIINKKVIIYHIHVFFYVSKYLLKDFPELKVIAAVRDQRPNIRRRVFNSIIKPNEIRLRKSDAFLMKQRSYRQIIRCVTEGLDSKNPIKLDRIKVFRHEDLATRLKSVMINTAEFLQIKYNECLLKPTWGGLAWKTTYYNFDTSNIANPEVLSEDWKMIESKRELFLIEGMCFDNLQKYYNGTLYYDRDSLMNYIKLFIASIIPTRIEIQHIYQLLRFDLYLGIIFNELKKIQNLKSYKKDLFYRLKWTNDGINFSRPRVYEYFSVVDNKNTIKILLKLNFARATYFVDRIVAFCVALCFMPINLLLRIKLSLSSLVRRIGGKRYIPQAL